MFLNRRHSSLDLHDSDGAKINIGGRQRMLSKKFSMETSAVLLGYFENNQTAVAEYLARVNETKALWISSKVIYVMNSRLD
jgi:hypothetical protein